jgi:hypothetical protein
VPVQLQVPSERPPWLVSRRVDFWLASGGASAALLASMAVIISHGDRELDWLDYLLSELHLGATYGAIASRRLWRARPVEVLAIPLLIIVLTYILWLTEQNVLLTSIAMYAALWHRGRQSFGVARFYQRQRGGVVSRAHDLWFRGAIYLPMLAAMFAYGHLAPQQYEGKPYFAVDFGAEVAAALGMAAALSVVGYYFSTQPGWGSGRLSGAAATAGAEIHPGERWVVLAHAIAFGSGYFLGAMNPSFIFVLAVHHEVQYLFFTYAMMRRAKTSSGPEEVALGSPGEKASPTITCQRGASPSTELGQTLSFSTWPVVGLIGALVGARWDLEWLTPLGIGGLFCHYWLDGRIWTRRSRDSDPVTLSS